MTEISNNNNINGGYYSTEMKVRRSNAVGADAPVSIPKNKLITSKELDQRLNVIDTDIYNGRQKEKAKNDFNKSLYFKIFGGVVLATAGIAGFSKIKEFFRKS